MIMRLLVLLAKYRRIVSLILGLPVNVKSYGAVGDGVTDDTVAIQAAISYVESVITDRFGGNDTIYFPRGTYKISSTLTITKSGVVLRGASTGASVIYAANANFDLVHFDGSALSLYQVGAHNLRFYTPGNATAGCHLKVRKAIHSIFTNLHFVGWYDGLITDGCGKTYYDDVIFSQENRTAGTPRYAIDFKSTSNNNSDVHVSNYQITQDEEEANYTISIRGSDGLYFSNGHQHGATLLQPSGSTVCASIFWNNIYFDSSPAQNVVFSGGTTGAYRNFWFNNCYFRDSASNGLAIEATSTISRVLINNCGFAEQPQYGIYTNSAVTESSISNCIFTGNNTSNLAGRSDIRCFGEMLISNNYFSGGGALGTALILTAESSNCKVEGNSFVNTTAGTKITDSGSNNKIRGNLGYVQKSYGQATITNPATSVVVSHGLAATPNIANIRLTFNDAASGVTRVYVNNVTSTQFTINSNATPTTSALIGWSVDAEA